jgi:hypothetical protein
VHSSLALDSYILGNLIEQVLLDCLVPAPILTESSHQLSISV